MKETWSLILIIFLPNSHLACLHHIVSSKTFKAKQKNVCFFLEQCPDPTKPNHQNQWVTLRLLLFTISHSIFAPNNNALNNNNTKVIVVRRCCNKWWFRGLYSVAVLCQNNEAENTLTRLKSAQHMYIMIISQVSAHQFNSVQYYYYHRSQRASHLTNWMAGWLVAWLARGLKAKQKETCLTTICCSIFDLLIIIHPLYVILLLHSTCMYSLFWNHWAEICTADMQWRDFYLLNSQHEMYYYS